MPSCAIATCSNTHRNRKKDVLFHKFPKDLELQKEWVRRCRRKDTVNPKNAIICSEHFEENDYLDDMQNRMLGLPIKRRLKHSSVPNVNLPFKESGEQITPRAERQKKRKILENAIDRINNLDDIQACSADIINEEDKQENGDICQKCESLLKEVQNLNFQLRCTKNELSILKKEKRNTFKIVAQKLRRTQRYKRDAFTEICKLKKKIRILEEDNSRLKKLRENIKGILSETQIAIISDNKKVNWTAEDISKSIVLKSLSTKSYDFWRKKIGIPLPGNSTLKRWCSKFECIPGILKDVLLLMKRNAENLTEAEKLCVLSFDEIHIDSKLCYDKKLDEILGPFKKVQFVLLRGLVSPWKQPVYFDFEKKMNKSLLFEIIDSIEKTGVQVVAIVSDLGGCQTLWKELNISETNSFFSKSLDPSKKIWIFADMPHYLKLLRNHFLDKGFILGDGTIIDSSIIKEVLAKDKGEIKLCYKLKSKMLNVKGNERQKVAPAKTLFSATTANAIKHLTGNDRASDFFSKIDNFFDIMNSKFPEPPSNKPLRAAFGLEKYHNDQITVLNLVKKEISELRVIGKKKV